MKKSWTSHLTGLLCLAAVLHAAEPLGAQPLRRTFVSIVGGDFYINGRPTHENRMWRGHRIEGLLLNARLVQGIFDDVNPETVSRWAYPDTGEWDADRNTREFIAAMPRWRASGMLAFTLNLQGGSPEGYSSEQPWENSAFNPDGSLRPAYFERLERILNKADELGMAVILGYFYFGQDERLNDEEAVIRAVDNATRWILERGYRNVLVEVNNEANVRYDHAILQPGRVHELISFVRNTTVGGRRLLASTSFGGGTVPTEDVVRASDFVLLHGNGVSRPEGITDLIQKTRALSTYRGQPVVINEDDHYDFDKDTNNFIAALAGHVSWGFFDFRRRDEPFTEGFQSVPADWSISSDRKRGFFNLVAEVTGSRSSARTEPTSIAVEEGVVVEETSFAGWDNAVRMRNAQVEAVIVPQIGRVMSFRFHNGENVMWVNEDLAGEAPGTDGEDWKNFGGDKAWPAPQSDWAKILGAEWPPPEGFDPAPTRAQIDGDRVVLMAPVERDYGLRVIRTITLEPDRPVMNISTRFEKVTGEPVRVSVWVVAQLNDPVGVYVPVPDPTIYPSGHHLMMETEPAGLRFSDGLLQLTRHPEKSTKIGTDADALLWMGRTTALKMESPRRSRLRYPDNSSSAEVYTSPGDWKYVELEFLSPLVLLTEGDRTEANVRYELIRRTRNDPEAEARAILDR